MPALSMTKRDIQFIIKNRLRMSGTAMAKVIGVNKGVVNRYMRANGLAVPKELAIKFRAEGNKGKTTFTPEEDKFISENYLKMPIKTLGAAIGRSFTGVMGRLEAMGLEIPKEIREERKYRGMYRKGSTPANKGKKQTEYMSSEQIARTAKTRFKKGNIPNNTLYDGAISIRLDHIGRYGMRARPYYWIRISPGKWQMLHYYLWEQQHGKVPTSYCLWFIDGNSMNCTLENIECISRAENLARNQIASKKLPEELQKTKKLLNKLNKTIKIHGTTQH